MTADARYDRFGWDYARFNPLEARAVAWYRAHARRTGGPILELACGTGRLLDLLVADGHEVVGLDRSSSMLRQAAERVGNRATLVEGDMASFTLGRRFALAIIADNSLREFVSEAGILACLSRVRDHLQPGGCLLVTERRFDPARFVDGVAEHPWSPAGCDPDTGAEIERRVRVRLDAGQRRLHGEMTYRAVGGNETWALPFESIVLQPEDYGRLFEVAGFHGELYVGYEARPDDGIDPHLCFVARPASG